MANPFKEISTSELLENLLNPNFQIIDIRPVDAYNGWKLKDEQRGGHIKLARSLPFKWAEYIDWIEIVKSKEIYPVNKIVIYGYDNSEINHVAKLFQKAGYKLINIYTKFLDEWVLNPELPMEKLERYNHLVYPEWLNSLIQGKTPPEYNGNKFVICHAHYLNPEDYEKGHIPGAISLNTLALESSKTWNRRTAKELERELLRHGIRSDTSVILYGRFSYPNNKDPFPGSSAGHLGAIRCAFIMMYAGVKDVRILNGGIQSWEDEGYMLSIIESKPEIETEFGAEIPACPEIAIDLPEAKEMLASDSADLICVRSWREYIGEVSGYNYIEKKGRIPGAIFGNCGSDAYHMENYRNLDHTTLEYQDILKSWNKAGIDTSKHLAFYCGTGWRGSEAFLNAWLIGLPKISVFDGGWFEWSNDDENPIETDY